MTNLCCTCADIILNLPFLITITAFTSIGLQLWWLPRCYLSTSVRRWYQLHFCLFFLRGTIVYIHLRSVLLLTFCPTSLQVLDSSLSWFLHSKTIYNLVFTRFFGHIHNLCGSPCRFPTAVRRLCCPSLTGDNLTVSFIMICVAKFYSVPTWPSGKRRHGKFHPPK